MLTPGFVRVLEQLERHDVRFLVIGSFATSALGVPRFVKDLDLWLGRPEHDAPRILAALEALGFGGLGLALADFVSNTVIQLGHSPVLVDLVLQQVHFHGQRTFPFEAEYPRRIEVRIDGVCLPLANPAYMLEIKKLVDRVQDQLDIRGLERGDPRTVEERIAEIERLRRIDIELHGDPDRPLARSVRRKRIRPLGR